MDRDLPQPGELWQHFKGNNYWIICIVKDTFQKSWVFYTKNDTFSELDSVFSTEDNLTYDLRWGLLGKLKKTKETWEDKDITDKTIWARPLEMFMDTLDDSRGGCFRFTKIDLDNICSKLK